MMALIAPDARLPQLRRHTMMGYYPTRLGAVPHCPDRGAAGGIPSPHQEGFYYESSAARGPQALGVHRY